MLLKPIHLIMTICLIVAYPICFAETCPSVHDIKNNSLHGFKAYDSDEGTPLKADRLAALKKEVTQFALAEWSDKTQKSGTIHCYYLDKNGSDLEAYFAKDHFIPRNPKNYWYQVSGFMQCAAGNTECEFKNNDMQANQLAKK